MKKNSATRKRKFQNKMFSEAGFTLAGVLIALAFLLIFMTAAATQWSFIKKRAKEEELIFRGTQYARALKFYYIKFKTFPNTLQELLDEKCIRQLYKDPMTEDGEWTLIRGVNTTTALTEIQNKLQSRETSQGAPQAEPQKEDAFKLFESMGPIIGVCSKSTEKSIKEYNNQRYYNLWSFIADMSELLPKQAKTEEQPQRQPEEREQPPVEEKEPETPPEDDQPPPD
jgi:type II secretory pathway pseudopilin PulG